jgi:hypothetical protein
MVREPETVLGCRPGDDVSTVRLAGLSTWADVLVLEDDDSAAGWISRGGDARAG